MSHIIYSFYSIYKTFTRLFLYHCLIEKLNLERISATYQMIKLPSWCNQRKHFYSVMVNHGLNKMSTMKIVYNLGVLGHLSPWVFLSLIVLGKFGSKKEKSLKFTKVLYYNKSSRIIFLFQNILILPIYRKCISIVYIYIADISVVCGNSDILN